MPLPFTTALLFSAFVLQNFGLKLVCIILIVIALLNELGRQSIAMQAAKVPPPPNTYDMVERQE